MHNQKLTAEELEALWTAYRTDGSKEAQELLWVHYESLARYLTRRALASAPAHQDPEDLLSFAHHGLLKAIERFNPDLGYKFETYATRRIVGAIKDGQRQMDPLTRTMRSRVKAYAAAKDDFWNEHGREPSDEELAELIGEDVRGVRELHAAERSLTASLDMPAADQAETSDKVDVATSGEDDTAVRLSEIRDALAQRLPQLPARERTFVIMHYCEGLPSREIAARLGVSVQWCEKVKSETLGRLRQVA